MMGYDYTLTFKKGTSNKVVDALSRLPNREFNAISVFTTDLFQRIKHSWVQDSAMVQLIHKIKRGAASSKYTWQNEQLR